jgi:predicted DNA-binding transcriptional regulator AlpA
MATLESLLSTAEMAERTGFSQSWFLTHRKNGTGPTFHRIGSGSGGAIRYRWSDWEAYLAARRVDPRSPYKRGDDS